LLKEKAVVILGVEDDVLDEEVCVGGEYVVFDRGCSSLVCMGDEEEDLR
jgi:hypothetical protein